jgi:hypothetical protein
MNTNSASVPYLTIFTDGGTYMTVLQTQLDWANGTTDLYSATNAIKAQQQFYHVAGTRTAAGVYKMYVNGVQSGATQSNAGSVVPTGNWYIGNIPSFNRGWVGCVLDAQVYNVVLTDAQVYALYASRKAGPILTGTNLIAYWPLNDLAQGASGDTAVFKDRSGNNHSGTGHKGTSGLMVQRLGGHLLR